MNEKIRKPKYRSRKTNYSLKSLVLKNKKKNILKLKKQNNYKVKIKRDVKRKKITYLDKNT